MGTVAVAVAACAAEGPTANQEPEPPPLPIALVIDAPRTGSVGTAEQVEFRGTLPAATLLRVWLLTETGASTDSVQVEVRTVSGDLSLGSMTVSGSQSAFGETQLFLDPRESDTPIRLLLRRRAGQASLPYRVGVFSPGASPEHVPELIAYGDTVTGEFLDSSTEIDRFRFAGAEGDEVIVFLRTELDAPGQAVQIEIRSVNDTLLTRFGFDAAARSLEEGSATTRLTQTGLQSIVISKAFGGAPGSLPGYRGPYSLWVHRIERAPESAAPVLTPGDTLTETLDVVGDIDEFSVPVTAGQELHLNFAVGNAMASGLQIYRDDQLLIPTHLTETAVPTLDVVGTNLWRITETRVHTLRIRGPVRVAKPLGTTEYRIELFEVSPAPETAAAQIVADVTHDGERIDRPGDLDVFEIALDSADIINVLLSAPLLTEEQGSVLLSIITPQGDTLNGRAADFHQSTVGYTGPSTAASTGTYKLHVRGFRAFNAEYSLLVAPIDPAPESVASVLPTNVWVVDESLDEPGDLDRFTVPTTADRIYQLMIRETAPGDPEFLLSSSVQGVGTSSRSSFAQFATTDRYRFSYTAAEPGILDLLVQSQPNSLALVGAPRYELMVAEWSIWPESADSLLSFGVPVNESLDGYGDSDEFVFPVTSGVTYRVTVTADPSVDPAQGVRVRFRNAVGTDEYSVETLTGAGSLIYEQLARPDAERMSVRFSHAGFGQQFASYRVQVEEVP